MEQIMELSPEQLESIGRYVRGNLSAWMGEIYTQRDLQLTERMVRFEQMTKTMDQRSEQVDQRFEDMHRFSNRWFTVMTFMLGIITIGVGVFGYLGLR